jgi:PAS domain S-box-containing protein
MHLIWPKTSRSFSSPGADSCRLPHLKEIWTGMSLESFRYSLLMIAIVVVYLFAAKLGLSLAFVHTNVSPVWPPTGIAIAALLVFGRRYWPAVLVGAFAVNFSTDVTALTAAGIAAGNTLEAFLAALFLERRKEFRKSLDSVAAVLQFVLIAAIFAPAVSATIGNLSLCLSGAAPWAEFGDLWFTWWLGDAFGALVVAPFFLAWTIRPTQELPLIRVVESGLLLLLLIITALVVFNGWFPGPNKNYPLAHLCLPFLVWAALRFDQRLLTAVIVLLSGLAIWGTSKGYGPFAQDDANKSLLLVQVFIASTTLTAHLLFAVISERRKAQEENIALADEVAKERQRVTNIVAHVPGVVWEAWGRPDASNQRINFVSGHVEAMMGYSEEEWLSTPNFWLTLVHPDDRERAAHEAAEMFASRQGGVSRFRWISKDGREVWVEAQAVVVCDESGAAIGMRGVTMDISSAVLAEQERARLLEGEREARAQAEEASRLKDEFLATVSHELRTPLNAIVGWSQLLSSDRLGPNEMRKALEVIERNALSQKLIIDDMLDVSRIITGKLRLGLTPVELRPVIQAAIDAIRPAAEAKDIKITARLDSPDATVKGDADRLQQVAWNLLSNAVKFTPAGGIVDVWVGSMRGPVEIKVADTGPGIDREFLPRAFERFSQADSSSTRRHGGLGLGLAIVRHLVELHGGSVEAANRDDGGGAIFTVTLPKLD